MVIAPFSAIFIYHGSWLTYRPGSSLSPFASSVVGRPCVRTCARAGVARRAANRKRNEEHYGSLTGDYGRHHEHYGRLTEQGKSPASSLKVSGLAAKISFFLRKLRFPSCTAAARPEKLGLRRSPQTPPRHHGGCHRHHSGPREHHGSPRGHHSSRSMGMAVN